MKTLKASKSPLNKVNNQDFKKCLTKGELYKQKRINHYSTHKNRQEFKEAIKSSFIPKLIIASVSGMGEKPYSNSR